MNYTMEIQPAQRLTDERDLKELLRRADLEAEQRTRDATTKAHVTKGTYNDGLQTKIQEQVNKAFKEYGKQAATPIGKLSVSSSLQTRGKRRLEDIDDETFVRGLTQPITLNLDDEIGGTGNGRRLDEVDDETFIRSITEPVTMTLD